MRPNLGRILCFYEFRISPEEIRPNLGHILLPFDAKFDEGAQNIFLS